MFDHCWLMDFSVQKPFGQPERNLYAQILSIFSLCFFIDT